MRRILFVGEQSTRQLAFSQPTGSASRLAAMLGVTFDDMLARYDFVNLLSPGKWSDGLARNAAKVLLHDLQMAGAPDRVVLLGARVTKAVVEHVPRKYGPLSTILLYGVRTLVFPHPSGRNRMFNNGRFKARAIKALRRFVR